MSLSAMKTASAVAVGVQFVLFAVSVLCPGLGGFPTALLSAITIAVLLRTVKGPPPDNKEEVEGQVAERTRELEEKLAHYEKAATTDALTGILNRRGIENAVTSHVARSRRIKTAFSFILCDIDHFKSVNDRYGHAIGDMVISGVAKALKENLRTTDFAGRWEEKSS